MTDLRIEASISINSQQLLEAVAQLPDDELGQFLQDVIAFRVERYNIYATQTETQLLDKINNPIPPKTQQRYNELIEKRQDATLTDAEYAELLDLTDVAEQGQVERVLALQALARLRGQTLDEVIASLGRKLYV